MTAPDALLREALEGIAYATHPGMDYGDSLCLCAAHEDARAALAATPPASAERDAVWPSPDDEAAVDVLARAMAVVVLPFVGVTVEMTAKEFRELMTENARHTLTLLRAAEARET